MQPIRGAPARRTKGARAPRAGPDEDAIGVRNDLLDNQAGGNERKKALGRKTRTPKWSFYVLIHPNVRESRDPGQIQCAVDREERVGVSRLQSRGRAWHQFLRGYSS